MSVVHLVVAGQRYALSCADGQEAHLQRLGKLLDDKVASVKAGGGVSEALGLVMAGVLLANDLLETQEALAKLTPQAQLDPIISPEVLTNMTLMIEKATKQISGVAQLIERS